jgi:hypothetical protein
MFFILFIIILSFLINFNFIVFNENLLLALCLILFFIIIYILLQNKIKHYSFFQIFQIFYIFTYLFKLNNFFNKKYILICLIKKKYINKIKIKLILLKKFISIKFFNILNKSNILINLYIFLKEKNILKDHKNNIYIYILFLILKLKNNDYLLFY